MDSGLDPSFYQDDPEIVYLPGPGNSTAAPTEDQDVSTEVDHSQAELRMASDLNRDNEAAILSAPRTGAWGKRLLIVAVVLFAFHLYRTAAGTPSAAAKPAKTPTVSTTTTVAVPAEAVTLNSALADASAYQETHHTFDGFTTPKGYLVASGWNSIVLSATVKGTCVAGWILNGAKPVVTTDRTGAACSAQAMADAQAAIVAGESN